MKDATLLNRALEIFSQAIEVSQAQQAAFLDTACGKDVQLRSKVEELLAADGNTSNPFATGAAIPSEVAEQLAPLPTKIGAYAVRKLIGEGGMGRVYLADRADGLLEQQVAIKVVRQSSMSPALLRQFHNERQILANLRHPNITNLLDGGTTEDGLPYVVMEHIQGETLTTYLRNKKPGLQQRITLFQGIAAGVAHAHQNLVIHRDLKPSNIMVTNDGQPKLLDFGIAKPLNIDAEARQETVAMVMTPSYASPEQLNGLSLSTATDVYSLGLLLFECLADQPLYNVAGRGLLEAASHISANHSQTPSRSLDGLGAKAKQWLAGDLDAIIAKATAPEPSERYLSVTELSRDLEAFVAGEPVSAQPQSLWYRGRKFAKRNWLGVGAGLAVLASISTASVFSSLSAAEADRQRAIALQQSQTAKESINFLKSMLSSVNPLTGEANAKNVDEMLSSMETELERRFSDRPSTRLYLMASAAELYLGRAQLDKASQYAEQAVAAASSADNIEGSIKAYALRVLAQVQLEASEYQAAADNFGASLQLYEAAPEGYWLEIASNYSDLGAALQLLDQEDAAREAFERALELHASPRLDEPESYATSLSNLAGLHMDRGDYAAAAVLQQQAIEKFEQGDSSQARVGMLQSNYAGTLLRLGDHQAAEVEYLAAIERMANAIGPEHPEILIAKTSLGSMYLMQKDLEKGVPLMQETVAIADRTLDPSHQAHSYAKNIAGQLLCEGGSAQQGSSYLRDALSARQAAYSPGHWAIASAQSSLGGCLTTLGQLDEAIDVLTMGHGRLLELRGPDHHMTQLAAERLAAAKAKQGS